MGEVARPLCAAPWALAPGLLPQAGKKGEGSARSPAGEGGRERPRACHSEHAVTERGKGVGSAGTWVYGIPTREKEIEMEMEMERDGENEDGKERGEMGRS